MGRTVRSAVALRWSVSVAVLVAVPVAISVAVARAGAFAMLLGLAASRLRGALSACVGEGDGRQVQMPLVSLFQGDVALNQFDDVQHVLSFVAFVDHRVRDAIVARTSGAANAVHVRFADVGDLEVDDVAHSLDVDASGSDVGGHKDLDFCRCETSSSRGRAAAGSCFHGWLHPGCHSSSNSARPCPPRISFL